MKAKINNIEFEAIELLDTISYHVQTYICEGYDEQGNKYIGTAEVDNGEIIEVTDIEKV